MYNYRYINKHCQFGRTCYTLILDDISGLMPTVRIDKEFNKSDTEIDREFLYQEAKKDIAIALKAYSERVVALPEAEEESAGE